MSHFMVMVLLPELIDQTMIEGNVQKLLAPYSENMEVDEYKTKCHCVNYIASWESHKKVEEILGDIKNVRNEFSKMAKDKKINLDDLKTRGELWREFAKIEDREKLQEELEMKHPEYNKPDPYCDDCNGAGIRTSTYNPNSKWDWWQIGGRWTGAFDKNYKPDEDPANQKICDLCNGTGYRTDSVAEEIRKTNPDFKCNGCKNGIAVKWPTEWKEYSGDIKPVREITDPSCYAIITPDGNWYERGEMGWFGISKNEKNRLSWEAEIIAILAEHQDCIAVCVDCHI